MCTECVELCGHYKVTPYISDDELAKHHIWVNMVFGVHTCICKIE
jgi:hypothetical protein